MFIKSNLLGVPPLVCLSRKGYLVNAALNEGESPLCYCVVELMAGRVAKFFLEAGKFGSGTFWLPMQRICT